MAPPELRRPTDFLSDCATNLKEWTETMSDEKREQVVAQCNAVSHLAAVLEKVHADFARIIQDGGRSDLILEQVGQRTASFMEQLGDMLNAMDACTEDDDWLEPIFEKAQQLWPTSGQTIP